jgi:hypothetical protein
MFEAGILTAGIRTRFANTDPFRRAAIMADLPVDSDK